MSQLTSDIRLQLRAYLAEVMGSQRDLDLRITIIEAVRTILQDLEDLEELDK